MKREEQNINDTWRMEDMFPSDEVWEQDLDKATEMVGQYSEFEGEISKNKENY